MWKYSPVALCAKKAVCVFICERVFIKFFLSQSSAEASFHCGLTGHVADRSESGGAQEKSEWLQLPPGGSKQFDPLVYSLTQAL